MGPFPKNATSSVTFIIKGCIFTYNSNVHHFIDKCLCIAKAVVFPSHDESWNHKRSLSAEELMLPICKAAADLIVLNQSVLEGNDMAGTSTICPMNRSRTNWHRQQVSAMLFTWGQRVDTTALSQNRVNSIFCSTSSH